MSSFLEDKNVAAVPDRFCAGDIRYKTKNILHRENAKIFG